jgi:hypothetical protein
MTWAQGVGRSNRPAPTIRKQLIYLRRLLSARLAHLWQIGVFWGFRRLRAATILSTVELHQVVERRPRDHQVAIGLREKTTPTTSRLYIRIL